MAAQTMTKPKSIFAFELGTFLFNVDSFSVVSENITIQCIFSETRFKRPQIVSSVICGNLIWSCRRISKGLGCKDCCANTKVVTYLLDSRSASKFLKLAGVSSCGYTHSASKYPITGRNKKLIRR